jgi:hypothetical protein
MAYDSDTTVANEDDLDSKPVDNEFAPNKLPFGGKTKIKGASGLGGLTKVSKGIGTRKSTSAPRGSGRKGSTTKSNALKNA